MPTKLNGHGLPQEYVPAGNGEASGEYSDDTGSNRHFTSFKRPEKTESVDNVNIEAKPNKDTEKQNIQSREDNYNYVIKNSTYKGKQAEKLKQLISTADKNSVDMLNKAYTINNNTFTFKTGSGCYITGWNEIVVDKADFENGGRFGVEGEVWFHENGHLIDNQLALAEIGKQSGNNWLSNTYKNSEGKTLNDVAREELRTINIAQLNGLKDGYLKQQLKDSGFNEARYNELKNKVDEVTKAKNSEIDNLINKLYKEQITFAEYKVERDKIKSRKETGLTDNELSEYEKLKDSYSYTRRIADNLFKIDFHAVSDLISARVSYGLGVGHSSRYMARSGAVGQELFADLFSQYSVNKKGYETSKKYMPKTVKMFEEIMTKYGK